MPSLYFFIFLLHSSTFIKNSLILKSSKNLLGLYGSIVNPILFFSTKPPKSVFSEKKQGFSYNKLSKNLFDIAYLTLKSLLGYTAQIKSIELYISDIFS